MSHLLQIRREIPLFQVHVNLWITEEITLTEIRNDGGTENKRILQFVTFL